MPTVLEIEKEETLTTGEKGKSKLKFADFGLCSMTMKKSSAKHLPI